MATLFAAQGPKYYICRGAAASEAYSFEPGAFYTWQSGAVPRDVQAYAESGLLEELPEKPAFGFTVTEIHQAWFQPKPRPEPRKQKMLTVGDICERLGWTRERFNAARARFGFPNPTGIQTGPDWIQGEIAPSIWQEAMVDQWVRDQKDHPLQTRG